MAAERETIDRLIARLPRRPDRRALSRPASPASPRSGCSSGSPKPAPTASCRRRTLGDEYFRFDEAAPRAGRDAHRRDLPARRQRRGQAAGGGAVRRRAAVRNADARRTRVEVAEEAQMTEAALTIGNPAPCGTRHAPRLRRPLSELRPGADVSRLSEGRRQLRSPAARRCITSAPMTRRPISPSPSSAISSSPACWRPSSSRRTRRSGCRLCSGAPWRLSPRWLCCLASKAR